jgi:hypothetical protein
MIGDSCLQNCGSARFVTRDCTSTRDALIVSLASVSSLIFLWVCPPSWAKKDPTWELKTANSVD